MNKKISPLSILLPALLLTSHYGYPKTQDDFDKLLENDEAVRWEANLI